MEVLAAPYARHSLRHGLAYRCNVDEQAIAGINPTCVDDILPVAAIPVDVGWVDIKKVGAMDVDWGGGIEASHGGMGCGIIVGGLIEMGR